MLPIKAVGQQVPEAVENRDQGSGIGAGGKPALSVAKGQRLAAHVFALARQFVLMHI